MAYIVDNPGVYMRELSEDLDLSMGVVQYQVWALVKDGKVEDFRNGRFRRFFKAMTYQEIEEKVISLMRQETPGRILLALSKGEPLAHVRLAETLGVTSQALTWQIGRLRTMGIINASSSQSGYTRTMYSLDGGVSRLVSQYLERGLASPPNARTNHSPANSGIRSTSPSQYSHPEASSKQPYLF